MLKEVGCGSSTPPGGDGAVNNRHVTTGENNANDGNLGCGGCGREIAERWYLRAADRAWHCGCLRCCHCRVPLAAELTCFARDGNIYCKEDYYRLFAVSRCSGCRAGISASELVMRARDLVYHVACFTCASCGTPLNKGDHFGQRDGLVYCRFHSDSTNPGCKGMKVTPSIIRKIDPSGGNEGAQRSVFSRERGRIKQKNCLRSRSRWLIHRTRRITQGRESNTRQQGSRMTSSSIPRPHYELLCCAGDYGSGTGNVEDIGSPGVSPLPAYYSTAEQSPIASSGTVQKGRPRKRKLSEVTGSELPVTMRLAAGALELLHPTELSSSMESLAAYDASVGSPGPVHQSQRTKRMRTSFKHHQLRTMKNYFAINQNPDAKDLKQLAQKTGLSKRVLQVWFQNARAKWRRNMMRQEGNNANSNVACPGTPIPSKAAGSPNIGPAASILGDSNSMPSTSMEELHALHHLHSGVSSQVSFSDLY